MNDYDYSDYAIHNSYTQVWNRAPDFRQTLKAVHLISDIVPYWCQIFQLIAMAVERYILICKGDRAAVLLSNNRRQIFDLFTVILSLIIPATIFAEYVYWEIEKVRRITHERGPISLVSIGIICVHA